jgi:hypothetical protein
MLQLLALAAVALFAVVTLASIAAAALSVFILLTPLAASCRYNGGAYVQSLVLGDDRSRERWSLFASIPDLGDLAAYGDTDKEAVAHVTELASHVCGPLRTMANPFRRGDRASKFQTRSDDPRR